MLSLGTYRHMKRFAIVLKLLLIIVARTALFLLKSEMELFGLSTQKILLAHCLKSAQRYTTMPLTILFYIFCKFQETCNTNKKMFKYFIAQLKLFSTMCKVGIILLVCHNYACIFRNLMQVLFTALQNFSPLRKH